MKKILMVLVIVLSLTLVSCNKKDDDDFDNGETSKYETSLKVLAIGNSFSDDSVDELWKIATSWGIPEVKVGMIYRGGTSLENHYNYLLQGEEGKAYDYFKYEGIIRTTVPQVTIQYGITDEDWDVIMVQQVSGFSGIYSSYNSPLPYLQTLLDHINEHKTNADAKIVFNMTWAYSKTSNHSDYWRYEGDQIKMYNAIVSAAKNVETDFDEIAFVLPTGTAIQNARPFVGDHNMTRDGYHLNVTTGRYIAAMSVFKKITGFDLTKIKHRTSGMDVETMNKVKQAVEAAYKNPYQITEIK